LRTKKFHSVSNISQYKKKILIWAQQFKDIVWLDSNNHDQVYSSYDAVLAVDTFLSVKSDYLNAFEKLKTFNTKTKDWIFGYLTYDLKNDVEVLTSENHDGLGFPDLYFFQPKKLFLFKDNTIEQHYLDVVDGELDKDIEATR